MISPSTLISIGKTIITYNFKDLLCVWLGLVIILYGVVGYSDLQTIISEKRKSEKSSQLQTILPNVDLVCMSRQDIHIEECISFSKPTNAEIRSIPNLNKEGNPLTIHVKPRE